MTRHVVSLLTSLRGDVTRHAGGPGRANRIRGGDVIKGPGRFLGGR